MPLRNCLSKSATRIIKQNQNKNSLDEYTKKGNKYFYFLILTNYYSC